MIVRGSVIRQNITIFEMFSNDILNKDEFSIQGGFGVMKKRLQIPMIFGNCHALEKVNHWLFQPLAQYQHVSQIFCRKSDKQFFSMLIPLASFRSVDAQENLRKERAQPLATFYVLA